MSRFYSEMLLLEQIREKKVWPTFTRLKARHYNRSMNEKVIDRFTMEVTPFKHQVSENK
jgi:hypothetical protein